MAIIRRRVGTFRGWTRPGGLGLGFGHLPAGTACLPNQTAPPNAASRRWSDRFRLKFVFRQDPDLFSRGIPTQWRSAFAACPDQCTHITCEFHQALGLALAEMLQVGVKGNHLKSPRERERASQSSQRANTGPGWDRDPGSCLKRRAAYNRDAVAFVRRGFKITLLNVSLSGNMVPRWSEASGALKF